MNQIRVGVVGAGFMGLRHAMAYQSLPTSRLVAVADKDLGRAKEVAARLGVRGYGSIQEMLEGEEVDALSICTPDWAHREPCLLAASAGKHLLVEKPLATSLEDCDAIIQAAAQAGVTLMVGHILRFDPRYALARQAVASGEIGQVTHIFARRNNTLSVPRRLGGGTSVIFFLAIHDIDWILWATGGQVTKVYAQASRALLEDLGMDDSAFLLLRLADGAVGPLQALACIEVCWALPEASASPLDARLEVVGTRGALYVDGHSQGLRIQTDRLRLEDTVYGPEIGGKLKGALVEELRHFLEAVATGRPPLISGHQARRAVEVALAAHKSLESGQPVEMG